ncbi:unnamed protein product [Phytophthora lilii]|uniref:Unnamed protein product n=1 Tax=Phytophthora lilii TaxID=2077276 RepID=A0A9W6TN62_9STRA|nr:unnamed protein product [Phytophthora lilii]
MKQRTVCARLSAASCGSAAGAEASPSVSVRHQLLLHCRRNVSATDAGAAETEQWVILVGSTRRTGHDGFANQADRHVVGALEETPTLLLGHAAQCSNSVAAKALEPTLRAKPSVRASPVSKRAKLSALGHWLEEAACPVAVDGRIRLSIRKRRCVRIPIVCICWQIDGSASLEKALAAYSGAACAVDVTLPLVAAAYAPNQSVALLWGVRLAADSTNAMDVPEPPDAMATLAADNADRPVQILSTYVRTCASRHQCTPGTLGDDTFTTAQSGNFSSKNATYFETLNDLAFAEEGNYTVAAVAVLANADNATLLYYFQTFADILDSDVLLASSDSSEIEVALEAASVVQAGLPVDIVWTATITRNSSKEIQLPSPLEAVYVLDDDGTDESGYYTIVGSVVKLCEKSKKCTEYSTTVDVSSADFSSNFTSANTATFNASGMVIPATGWYAGFAQVTLAGNDANSQRYDFIRYFEVFATEENVAKGVQSATYDDNGSESYCWEVVAAADDENVDATSVAFAGNSTNCPYTLSMTVSTTSFSVDTGVEVSWTVAKQTTYTATNGVTVNTTTVYDETSGQYVNLPQVNVYYCNDTTCSPFSASKTLAYAAAATSFSTTSGDASFSTTVNIPSEGTYALMAHAVVPNGEVFRFDVASFMSMTVTASSTSASSDDGSNSHVGLILGLTLGCLSVICLACWGLQLCGGGARRRQPQFKKSGDTASSGSARCPTRTSSQQTHRIPSHGSDESGHFMYVKAARSPMDMPRASSLSYDPYSRRSFVEAGNENSGYSFTFSDPEPQYPSSNERTTPTQLTPATHQF